jgi:hypothetical protein
VRQSGGTNHDSSLSCGFVLSSISLVLEILQLGPDTQDGADDASDAAQHCRSDLDNREAYRCG